MYEKKINLNGFNSHIHVVLVLIIKLSEISLQDIVKTVWPDIHVGISAKCLLPSLWHLFVSRWLKVQREEGKRINLCPSHSYLNCTETVPRIVTFCSQDFFFFQLDNKLSSWNQLLSFNEYLNQKKITNEKKPCFIFVDLIILIILVFIKAKILFEYSGAKSFFLFGNKKTISRCWRKTHCSAVIATDLDSEGFHCSRFSLVFNRFPAFLFQMLSLYYS